MQPLAIALVAGVVNLVLSLLVPWIASKLNRKEGNVVDRIGDIYDLHKNVLLTSTLVTIVFVFISAKITPKIMNSIPVSLKNFIER